MFKALISILSHFLSSFFKSKADLAIENLLLRHQLAVLKSENPRPKISDSDRLFWVLISKRWSRWKEALIFVKPETVISWHRRSYNWFWKRKVKQTGRPSLDKKIVKLIRQMAIDNGWGAPRIHGELLKLGFIISERTISKYLPKNLPDKGQGWKAFIENHMDKTIAIDFLMIPTLFFKQLLVFVVLSHDRRKILHFNVCEKPSYEWINQQLKEAFPFDHKYKFLIRDNDSKYCDFVLGCINMLGFKDCPIQKRKPWQNGYCERVIGTVKRELFQKIIPLNEKHLRRLMKRYIEYYNNDRTHIGLNKDSPSGRSLEKNRGKVTSENRVGGLYKKYFRESKAA